MQTFPIAIASAFLASSMLAQELEPGFRAVALPSAGSGHVYTTLPDGRWLALDSNSLELYDESGALVRTLYTFNFGSPLPAQYVAVDPTLTYVMAGHWDGGAGGGTRIAFDGPPNATFMPFVIGDDVAFSDPEHLILAGSDGVGGFSMTQVNILTGATNRFAATFTGFYSPIALDGAGNLFVAHGSLTEQVVERFTPAQIASFDEVAPGNGVVVDDGYHHVVDLAVSEDGSTLYVGENPIIGSGPNRIVESRLNRGAKTTLLAFPYPEGLGYLERIPPAPPAEFLPFQPPSAGRIVYYAGTSSFERRSLEPARPTLALAGPGTTGIGPFDLTLTGGPPGGSAFVFYGSANLYNPSEIVYSLRVPLFIGLDPGSAMRAPGVLALDAAGSAVASYPNPTGITEAWAIQVVLFDAVLRLVGSSSAAFL